MSDNQFTQLLMVLVWLVFMMAMSGCAAAPVNHAQKWDCDSTGACWQLGGAVPQHRIRLLPPEQVEVACDNGRLSSKWMATHTGSHAYSCTIGANTLPVPIIVLPDSYTAQMLNCNFTREKQLAHERGHLTGTTHHNMIVRKEGC